MSLLRRVIGGVLRRLRLRQGRTLREVAEAAGVSLPYLSEVERGRKEASSEVLAAICRALGINLSDLLEEARDDLRRVERRIPAAPRAALSRLDRVPAARGENGPTVRIGFQPAGATPPVSAAPTSCRHPAGPVLRLGGPILHVGGPASPVGSTVGGAGLRVRLIASAPAGRPGPRTSRMLARRRARAGRRRLTAV
ncbi:transcriptional regulator with XRE-family HTH domain [Micromonospora palomenae]|uniref:Transcriptional regulator with XRE-family HTH domain n=1 Tax=Micromonospora palomenae TaxID=1461247 RepID=A0A561WDQ8_9ACTN|nr:helix-turn-helix transcriptional regulator [Micromonospora palomenae]TWG21982.1 transcriptional regulator with XRE-family HTH domain [Micromonospora palomenae]